MFKIERLSSRIILFFAILLTLVEATSFVLVSTVNARQARYTIDDELQTGERVLRQQLELRRQQLAQAAAVIAADTDVRTAIARDDAATLSAILRAHGERFHAGLIVLATHDGTPLADMDAARPEGRGDSLIRNLVRQARVQGRMTAMRTIDGSAYQLVIAPVGGTQPIAWVIAGSALDDHVAADFFNVTGQYVSFVAREGAGWRPLASLLPGNLRVPLANLLRGSMNETNAVATLTLAGQAYESRLAMLDSDDGQPVAVVLQRSLDEAMGPFVRLRTGLLLLSIYSLLVSAIASFFVARSITRPLALITRGAARIREGDYSVPIETGHSGEIEVLADSINHMRRGIAEREREILRLAYDDPLTGLPNRLKFNSSVLEHIQQRQANLGRFAVMMMDLDRFKIINRSLGHEVGDAVLKNVAARLRDLLGQRGTVARLGGDEFGIVQPITALDEARDLAQRILRVLEEPVSIEGQSIDVSASLGIASFPIDGQDPSTLIRHADSAMYTAKQNHSGFEFFNPLSETERLGQLSLLGELRRAVERNELRVWYQPKVDLHSGVVCGVEALVRWEHPHRSIVLPYEFLPFAERTGYIRAITQKVLDVALRDCGRWGAEGLMLEMSINISTRDLLDPELPLLLRHLLDRHRVPADHIALEITESSFMHEPELALNTLTELDALGVQLSIDDFGTGYSSLSYLKKLPVDEMKIDQTFVRNMVNDPHDLAIVRSTIDLAHNLGLKVVAEGVEDQHCFERLRFLGCDQAQGYFVSRPLPEDQLRTWWQRWHQGRRGRSAA
jgi:diguanylate cyclase (GGDEF)-like protein